MKFLGFKRKDGSVGVRNHVLILPARARQKLAVWLLLKF